MQTNKFLINKSLRRDRFYLTYTISFNRNLSISNTSSTQACISNPLQVAEYAYGAESPPVFPKIASMPLMEIS